MKNAYEAIAENPRVFCAYGESPSQALRRMAKLLENKEIKFFSASHVGYVPEEQTYYINIYV